MGRLRANGDGTVLPTNGRVVEKVKGRERASNRASATPGGAAQVGSHGKRSKEWSNKLHTKADEIERVFAVRKPGIRGDRVLPFSPRGRNAGSSIVGDSPGSLEKRSMECSVDPTPERSVAMNGVDGGMGFDGNVKVEVAREQDFDGSLELSDGGVLPKNSRGGFYERYTQIRDAKLREEWGLERDLKEAKMKALEDRLEESRVEMKALFSRSASRRGSAMLAKRCAEKLKANAMAKKAEEDAEKHSGVIDNGKDRCIRQTPSGGNSLKRALSNKFVSSRSATSPSTPRTPTATPKSFSRPSTVTVKRRVKPEQSNGHSVSNFTDSKRQNNKPLNGTNKAVSHMQPRIYALSRRTYENVDPLKPRIYALSRRTYENVAPLKEGKKSHQSLAPRKKSVNPIECNDLAPSKKLRQENPARKRVQKGSQPKSSLTNGEAGSGARKSLAKGREMSPLNIRDLGLKGLLDEADSPSVVATEDEKIKEEEGLSGQVGQVKSSPGIAKEDEQSQLIISTKEVTEIDKEKSVLSTASMYSQYPDSEVGGAPISNAQMQDDASPAVIVTPSEFGSSAKTIEESPEEVPASENNTHVYNSLSSVQEPSGINASEDTTISSPAAWHTHPSYQMVKADSTWMTADKPALVANAPSRTAKRNLPKALRRLLNFGRKRRGRDKLVKKRQSVSTNSQGKCDTEANRKPINQLSSEVEKSRFGFSQHHYILNDSVEVNNFYDQGQRSQSSIPTPENYQMRVDNISATLLKGKGIFMRS